MPFLGTIFKMFTPNFFFLSSESASAEISTVIRGQNLQSLSRESHPALKVVYGFGPNQRWALSCEEDSDLVRWQWADSVDTERAEFEEAKSPARAGDPRRTSRNEGGALEVLKGLCVLVF